MSEQPRAGADAETREVQAGHDASTRGLVAARPLRVVGDAPPAAGDELGGAVLLELLGRGGMGVVWRARDAGLGRDVAVKVLRQVREAGDLARFRAEGEAAARLRHPHVLRVHSAGERQGWPYLVLDLVEGESLAARLARTGPLAPREAVELARAVASALAHAHARGVVHRDVKPANVLLGADGAPQLADFGLARDLLHDARLTPTGAVVGTPAYMAPEQLAGRPVDARADVWALGATLHELLTGRTPFAGLDGPPLLVAMERGPAGTGVDARLDAVLAGCLAFAPEHRYPSAAALEADLARWLVGEVLAAGGLRAVGRSPGPVVAVAGALAALGLLGGLSVAATLGGPSPTSAGGPAAAGAGPVAGRLEPPPAPGPRSSGRAGPPPVPPRDACEALVGELRGARAADLDAIAAGLAEARRDPPRGGLAERAAALAAEVLEARVLRAAAAALASDPVPALAAAHRAARALALEGDTSERLARARLEGLRRAPWGPRLAAAVERRDPRQVQAIVDDLVRAARAEPPLLAPARLELARWVRAAVATAGPPEASPGAALRDDPRHPARVALEDRLFYGLAPEGPPGEGVAWARNELVVGTTVVVGRDRELDAPEALALLRGQHHDSWRHVLAVARQSGPARPELERRAAAGSAAAHLLLLAGLARADGAELVAQLPALRACRAAPIQDLQAGVAALVLLRLGRARLLAEGPAAGREVEALAAEARARLADQRTAEGLVTERLGEAWMLVLDARAGDPAAIEEAVREGLAHLGAQAPFVDTPQEARSILVGRASLLGLATGLLDPALPDGPALDGWFDQAEVAAAAARDDVDTALSRRLGHLERHRPTPAATLREAGACWTNLAPAVRALREEASEDDRRTLEQLVARLTELAEQAAAAAGDEAAAAEWRGRR